jgi:putative transposase
MARVVLPGYPHHVTQRGAPARRLFAGEDQFAGYLSLLGEHCTRSGLEVLAWCLVPDGVYLVVVPPSSGALAEALGAANKRYTRAKNRSEGARGSVFRGRFASCPLDERHTRAAVRCAETAPVRAGLVARAADWRFSSAGFHLGRRRRDPLVRRRGLLRPVEDWAALLSARDQEAEASLRRCTSTGRPAGDRRFVVRVERLSGRPLRRRRPGRKARNRPPPAPRGPGR